MTTLPQTAPIRVPRPMPAGSITIPAMAGPLAGVGPVGQAGAGGLSMADVLRVIRQNIWLILLAVVVGGMGGYFANWYLLEHYPKFKASGNLLVHSKSEQGEPGDRRSDESLRTDEIELLKETDAKTIMHESLFIEALDRPGSKLRDTDWFKSFAGQKDQLAAAKKNLLDNLNAYPEPRSRLLRVEMSASTPDDARTVLLELVDTFITDITQEQKNQDSEQVRLLVKEKGILQNELDEDVSVKLRGLEQQLGANNVELASAWNGKRMQQEAMLIEEAKIRQEVAGLQTEIKSLDEDLRDGRTPADVQMALSRDNRYVSAKQRVDDVEIQISLLQIKFAPFSDQVISEQKLQTQYQQKVDEIREDLKSDYADTMRKMLQNKLVSYQANQSVIAETIEKLAGDLGRLNKANMEYVRLKDQETRIREQINTFDKDIRRVKEFRLAVSWSQAQWSSRPLRPDGPSFPKLWVTLSVSVMAALALSLGIAFLREITDTTVRSPRDIAKVGQITLLGLIPHESDDPQAAGSRLQLAILDAPNSHIAEQFRQIRTRMQYAHSLDTTRSILVTSPSPQDGKSIVACNLAASLALNGRRILLVDANFRRPQLHTLFNAPNEMGFGDILSDLDRLPEAVRETDVPNLNVMVAGTRPANTTELLESQLFIDFIERALEEYDHVIFDSGPMLMVSESVAMAPRVDGVVTVVGARGNSRGLLQRMRDELRRVKAEHIGVVLNGVRSQGGGYYGRNIKSYYAYGNG